ncbi:MAG: helix-turn-helix family protein [Xanthomonadaceae bacterium]|nr:helix-turn-helix family protein [Xanthomonadaceae bacterium]
MTSQSRIRLARRHAGLSQLQLAQAVGVQRSAVSHWESSLPKNPSVSHLRDVAQVTGVQFEWLATGRGEMEVGTEIRLSSVPAAAALLVEEPIELRLLRAFRAASAPSRIALVEIAEQLASGRGVRSYDAGARAGRATG